MNNPSGAPPVWPAMRARQDSIWGCLGAAGCLALIVAIAGVIGIAIVWSLLYPAYINRLVQPAKFVWTLNPFFNYWPTALIIGIVVALAMLIAAGRRRAGLIGLAKECGGGFLAGLLLGATLLSLLTSFGAQVNAQLDTSLPQTHSLQVIDKARYSGRFGTRYYFVVADWRAPGSEPVLVFIGLDWPAYEVYRDVPPASIIQVTTRSGYLGLEWVEAVKVE